jgi:hypothetical protein
LGILGFSACIATSWLQCWGVVELAVVSLLLKELGVVMFAVKSAFQSCIIGGADCATTMDTLEAVFMIWQTLHTCLHHNHIDYTIAPKLTLLETIANPLV